MLHASTQNILISACLLGDPVRYNGTGLLLNHPLIQTWKNQNRLISMCPELAGGMKVPRAPAEISYGDGNTVLQGSSQVIDNQKNDVTAEFILGAQKALQHAQKNNCIAAILTERSPSCGSNLIYNGTFSGVIKDGMGATTALLESNGIKVFNQHQLEALESFLKTSKNKYTPPRANALKQ